MKVSCESVMPIDKQVFLHSYLFVDYATMQNKSEIMHHLRVKQILWRTY